MPDDPALFGIYLRPEPSMRRSGVKSETEYNKTRTPLRAVRVPEETWAAAQAEAAERGESVSAAINRFLERYGKAKRQS